MINSLRSGRSCLEKQSLCFGGNKLQFKNQTDVFITWERMCFLPHLHSWNKVRHEHDPRFLVGMSKECLWNQNWVKTILVLAETFGASNRKIAKSLFLMISLNINHSLIYAKNNCAHDNSKMQIKIQIYNFIIRSK